MIFSSDESAQLWIQIAVVVGVLFAAAFFFLLPGFKLDLRAARDDGGGTYLCDSADCERVESLQVTVLGNGRVRINGRELATREIPQTVRYDTGPDARVTTRIAAASGANRRDVAAVAMELAQTGIPATSIRREDRPDREPH